MQDTEDWFVRAVRARSGAVVQRPFVPHPRLDDIMMSVAAAVVAATRARTDSNATVPDADDSGSDAMEDDDGSDEDDEEAMDEDNDADAENEQDETRRTAANAAIADMAAANLVHTNAFVAGNPHLANAIAATANAPSTDHFVTVNRGDAVEESSACKVCLTDPDPMEAVYVECGHVWCKGCLNQYFSQVFTDRDRFPPRCCRPEGFEISSIQMYLDDEVLMHVAEKWEEWSAEDPTYCANIQCGAFISADQIIGQVATCLYCKVRTCVDCNAKMILHHLPDQHPAPIADKVNEELAKKEGWKRCPYVKCNRYVEKTEGCDTMTCKCGEQFCYRCGNSFEGPFPCTCGGNNAWVGQVQAWANGADGDGDDGDGNGQDDSGEDNDDNEDDEMDSVEGDEDDDEDEADHDDDNDEDSGDDDGNDT